GVVGLVGFGSTAERWRADEWSDHDFALVIREEATERLRGDLAWLPHSTHLVATVQETHDGFRGIYEDGHVLEFGVPTLDDLQNWRANAYDVVLDRGGVADAMAAVAAKPAPGVVQDDEGDLGIFLSLLLIGVGRYRRGEILSSGESIRSFATRHLLLMLARRLPSGASHRLDTLDPFRRVEQVHPELAARISNAQAGDVETCARVLLEIAESALAPGWDEFPWAAVTAVRRRLGWT
ncbi:MAG TPA: hypothetical protein VIL55_16030, partial [Naasia sp.]